MKHIQTKQGCAPVIKLVDDIIYRAVRLRASDIHCESQKVGLRIRYRIDGILYDQEVVALSRSAAVLSRIQILAQIDIAKTRIAQDGKFCITVDGRMVDIRVSTFPGTYGQKIVLRILDRNRLKVTLETLGMSNQLLIQVRKLIARPGGFFLVTGPTGSGKTTTLYSVLTALNTDEKNIITLEDPVEYSIDGITQGQVHPQAGFTFEGGLRALLRQDPDVVMVGEVRDAQTAAIAIKAALTGHMVLSTLHTNDAPGVVTRLIDMGIEPFLINAALSGALAQRLARTICSLCKISYKPTDQERAYCTRFGYQIDLLFKGAGCDACHHGHQGRTGLFQLLTMDAEVRAKISEGSSPDEIARAAKKSGMRSLLEDGLHKVVQGIITLPELMRVVS